VLEVVDDGPGRYGRSPRAGTGTGLTNTRERLRHAYGAEHAFAITSPPGGGTTVRLELPATGDLDDPFWGES
jgi:signal transduction histidine kinase